MHVKVKWGVSKGIEYDTILIKLKYNQALVHGQN